MKVRIQMKNGNLHVVQEWEVKDMDAAIEKFIDEYKPKGIALEEIREVTPYEETRQR